ncbi:MAG TPA: hypothetical protein VF590_26910, partial [Isosphaeraceae bacterium]
MSRSFGMTVGLGMSAAVLWAASGNVACAGPAPSRYVATDESGRLVYRTDARGDRLPDFSHCGYRGGGVAIPDAPARVVLAPAEGDDGARIQAALDRVARLPADAAGLRGAVLLEAGRYDIAGGLRIAAGGVVLRGRGDGPDGTVLVARGTGRRTLIRVAGRDDRRIVSDP